MPFRIIIVLIGAIGGAITAAVSPYLGLLMLVFLNFGRPQDDRPNVEPLHIPMMITVAVLVGLILRAGKYMPAFLAALRTLKLILLFYLVMVVSALTHWTELSKNRVDDFTALMCFCLLTLTVIQTEKELRGYLNAILFSGFYVIVRVLRNPSKIVEHIAGEAYERAAIAKGGTVFGNSNYLALFMVLTIFLAVAMMSYYHKLWQRVVLLGLMGGAGYVFFQANSRGASIALGAGTLVMWLLSKKKMKMAVGLILLVSIAAALAPDSYWSRLSTVSNYEEDASARDRLQLWNIALGLIPEHPVLGVGPDNFVLYAPNTPHNAYLQVGSEIGIPALLIYVSILLTGLYRPWSARKRFTSYDDTSPLLPAAALGIFCCVLAVTVQGFTTGLAHREVVYVFVTISLVLSNLASTTKKSGAEAHVEAPKIASPDGVESTQPSMSPNPVY